MLFEDAAGFQRLAQVCNCLILSSDLKPAMTDSISSSLTRRINSAGSCIRLHSSLHEPHVEHVRQNGHEWPSENTESSRAAGKTQGCGLSEEVSAALYTLTASSAPAGAAKTV